jgi:ribonuclease P/MRP protein subunit RPP1
VDLISLDLARRLPFRLRPAALAAAAARGVALELCYAPALRDEAARRNLFGNAAGAGAAVARCCACHCPSHASS